MERFDRAARDALYRLIAARRDMRHFRRGRVAPDALRRILAAGLRAPSVGHMQPWRFVRVTRPALREEIHAIVERERRATARALGEREDEFLRLKVHGVRECAELLVVALMEGREAHVFGRRTLPEMDVASVGCAIQNMWLASRAENLGMGWVSLFDPGALAKALGMPAGARPLAILCLGPVDAFYARPMLELEDWARRRPLAAVVFEDAWGRPPRDGGA